MSENKHFGRRRRGKHFRPPGGMGTPKRQEREAQEARADAVTNATPS